MKTVMAIGSLLLFGIAFSGCNKTLKAADVQRDVAAAQAERSENVADASRDGAREINRQQQDVNAQRGDVSQATTDRNYEVAMAKAEGDYMVAKETCRALAGDAQQNCKDQAVTMFRDEKSRVEMLKAKAEGRVLGSTLPIALP